MTCTDARTLISPYLDGRAASSHMRALAEHMAACGACAREYRMLKLTQGAVSGLGRKQPPPDLTLRLRVLASQEAARQRRPRWAVVQMRVTRALEAFMVPATAGAVSAVVILGLLIGFFAAPAPLRASRDDVPTMLYTPPQLVTSPFACAVGAKGDDGSLVVEAVVDESGRVQDYRILSAPAHYQKDKMSARLENMLIFTIFSPARAFGRPTTGRAIVTFSSVNVRG